MSVLQREFEGSKACGCGRYKETYAGGSASQMEYCSWHHSGSENRKRVNFTNTLEAFEQLVEEEKEKIGNLEKQLINALTELNALKKEVQTKKRERSPERHRTESVARGNTCVRCESRVIAFPHADVGLCAVCLADPQQQAE